MSRSLDPPARPPPARPVRATYRLQLQPGRLGFGDAEALVGYLAALGVTHLYCSPILEARPGSTHGYDVADPGRVRRELGGEEGLRRLADAAHGAGLGLVVDIVPNHVGVDPANPLWEALLAEGRDGPAARFFDVDWEPALPGASGKVVLPVLGAPFGEVLHAGELRVVEADGGRLRVRYHEHSWPLSAASQEAVRRAGGPGALEGEPGEAGSWDRMAALLERQHYRLVWWRAGSALVNYRRFFAIDDLAAVRVEDPEVFDRTHAKVLELVDDGVIDGLRVDHPDGLRDPGRYFDRLAERSGGVWTVAEKITARGESLPGWPVAGTTGYDFANDVLGLFVDPGARGALDELDGAFGGTGQPYGAVAVAGKREAAASELPGDVERLARLLWRVAQTERTVRDVTLAQCREVLVRVASALEVYRTYVDPETGRALQADRERIDAAVRRARERLPDGSTAEAPGFLYRFLGDALAGRAGATPEHLDLIARFQQLSSALEAKGIEDTALYRYRRLLALNEVGGDPGELGTSVAAFHARNAERAERHPLGMLTTATHDTKRGEDVRLRMAALTELGERWPTEAARWRRLNAEHVAGTRSGPAPDEATELLVYQTLVGVWPLDGGDPDGEVARRVADYAVKASREAGVRTDHADPDAEFEAGVVGFIEAICDRARSAAFLDRAGPLCRKAGDIAIAAGLAQTLLRATSPGVPDTYQGTELWDDSLVDPDNRRPVDFALRARLLDDLRRADPVELAARRDDGRLKLWVLSRALHARAEEPAAFGAGSGYLPLAVEGAWADHVVAFARTAPDGARGPLAVAPRLPGAVTDCQGMPVGDVWEDTAVVVPAPLQGPWRDCLSEAVHDGDRLPVARLLATLPVALLAPSR